MKEEVDKLDFCWTCLKIRGSKIFIQEVCEEELKERLDCLLFLYHLYQKKYPTESCKTEIGVIESKSKQYEIIYEGNRYESTWQQSGQRENITLTKRLIDEWVGKEIGKKIIRVLATKSSNPISRRVIRALSFYTEASFEKSEDLQLMKYVIGLEALLGTDRDDKEGRISNNLAEKTAFLLSDNLEKRIEIKKEIKSLYKKRSNTGHGSSRVYEDFDVHLARDYLFHTIIEYLEMYEEKDGFNSEKDIDKWFEAEKMS